MFVAAILLCAVSSFWLPRQPALIGHSTVSVNATQNGAGGEERSCQASAFMQADDYPALPAATEAKNKQPVGSEQLTALLISALFWVLLRSLFASAPSGVAFRFTGAGLPAMLRCRPGASAASIFCVFRI